MINFEEYYIQQESMKSKFASALLGASLLGNVGNAASAKYSQPTVQTVPQNLSLAADFFERKIKPNEGLSLKSYKDKDGRSIGYGHFLNPKDSSALVAVGVKASDYAEIYRGAKEITAQQAAKLFYMDFPRYLANARAMFPNFDKLKRSTQLAILDSTYRGDMGRSPKARKLMNYGKWKQGADEYMDFAEIKKPNAPKGIVRRMKANADAFKQETFTPTVGNSQIARPVATKRQHNT